jgi:hypothetical protein
LEACFPRANAFWAGLQPFGNISGIQDMQGTIDNHKWRAADWLITAIGGAGTTLVPASTHPETATFVTRATADNDGYNIQWSMDGGTTSSAIFTPTAGQMILCYGRFKVDNASTDAHTKSRFHFGLSEDDAGIHASDEDTIEFYKASAAATMVGRIANDGTATDTAALGASLVDNTYISLGFRVNGVSSVEFWQGTTAGDMTLAATQTTMTNLPGEPMALSFEGQTSEAAAITFYLQHMVAFQEAI